jgi:hypothetical protein
MVDVARNMQPTGDLQPVHISRHGFYTKNELNKDGTFKKLALPDGVALRHRARTALMEEALRFRLAAKGAWRGFTEKKGVLGVGRLYATVIRANGGVEHLGLISTKLVTDAGVAYIVDDWDGGANTIDNFNYHGCGTGTTAEAAGDTALVTESTTILNPDSTRATGTKSQPAANQMRTVGTATFDGAGAITEHGIFTQAATGGGTLLDRSVFSAINVANGDSIQFTYTLTLSSGG